MVVWRGKGWIVMAFALLAIGIPLGLNGLYRGLGQLLLFFIFGLILWLLGNKLNAGQNHYSKQAGKFVWKDIFEVGYHNERDARFPFGVEWSPSHSFSLVKMQYWYPVFISAGIYCLVLSLFE